MKGHPSACAFSITTISWYLLTVDAERGRCHVVVGLGHKFTSVNQLGRLDDQLVLLAI